MNMIYLLPNFLIIVLFYFCFIHPTYLSHKKLKAAHRDGTVVEGTIKRATGNGYIVKVNRLLCFCPGSLSGLPRDSQAQQVGKTLNFHVADYDKRTGKATLTRKKIVSRQLEEKYAALKDQLKPGNQITGIVRDIKSFGAFVTLHDGIDALLPASEVSHHRGKVTDLLTPGQSITAEILSVDDESRKIALSTKKLQPHPFEEIQPGMKIVGKVTRLEPYGAFVQINPSVTGLAHVSNIPSLGNLAIGQEIPVEILSVDKSSRRISLAVQ